MDITTLFRACIKAVRVRKKIADHGKCMSKKTPSKCTQSAVEIINDISQLRDFLLKNRREYINIDHLSSSFDIFSDYDRDKIDTNAETAIRSCKKLINNFAKSVKIIDNDKSQVYRHEQAVVDILNAYLKAVCRIYSEQKAVRVKKSADLKRMSRLATLVANFGQNNDQKKGPSIEKVSIFDENPKQQLRRRRILEKTSENDDNCTVKIEPEICKADLLTEDAVSNSGWEIEDYRICDFKQEFSDKEQQQLVKENEVLFGKLNLMVNEIDDLEGKVVEIGRLQEVFSDKVLNQEDDIYRINEVAIHTTENVHSGNEQIREALKRKASMRVYVLFFLVVLTFSLLFLDWFNP